MDKYKATKYPCKDIKYIKNNGQSNCCQGSCIIVPVTLHNICENEHLLVIVEVYKNQKLYTREIRKIFTGCYKVKNDDDINCYSCNDCDCCNTDHCNNCNCGETYKFFVGNFEFYFIDKIDPRCISIQVKTQCIFDC